MSNRTHTDSSIIEHHDDGSYTETTVITHLPATRSQKIAAWSGVGAVLVLPFVPVVAIVLQEKFEARREARRAKKNLTAVESTD